MCTKTSRLCENGIVTAAERPPSEGISEVAVPYYRSRMKYFVPSSVDTDVLVERFDHGFDREREREREREKRTTE